MTNLYLLHNKSRMIKEIGQLIMNKQILSIVVSASFLTGCGGGSDSSPSSPPPELQTGVFTDSPVKGLYYETETQSGMTNELGEFTYIEGETITFKLGGSLLGVSKAQGIITPFTLTGVKALRNQREITNAFLSPTPNSFEKAINIATLLQGLDIDGNPENGIDLGSAHQNLANLNIQLLQKSTSFTNNPQYTQARTLMQVNHQLSFVEAAEHLYSNLGVEIESSLISKQTNNSNSATKESISYEYDTQNRIAAVHYDRNNDGTPEVSHTFTYDDEGRLSTIYNSADDSTQTLLYDSNNKIVSRNTESPESSGLREAFDYQDDQLKQFKLDKSADGQDDFITNFNYDTEQNLAGYEIDSDGDNQVDKTIAINRNNGKVIRFTESNTDDTNNIDIAYNYDSRGNKISQQIKTSESDTSQAKFFYDSQNNLSRYELDTNLDGVADLIESYKYNTSKQRTLYLRDDNADGQWNFLAQYFYDANGNRIKMIEDSDGNGIVDKVWEANLQGAKLESTWQEIAKKL